MLPCSVSCRRWYWPVLGLGMAYTHSVKLKGVMDDFKSIIDRVIAGVIIPLLPFYIFGIFLR